MKRLLMALTVVGMGMLMASYAQAFTGSYTPGTGINGTVHDLAVNDPNTGMSYAANPDDTLDRICIFCHAPHNTYKLSPMNLGPGAGVGGGTQAPDAFDYLPLWNHELTGNADFYTPYQNGPGAPTTGSKASQAIAANPMPGSVSLLCLSCHDGSVAVNSYGTPDQLSSSQSGGGGTIGAQYVIGKDNYLGNHHPVGFSYLDADAIDTELRPADTTPMGAAEAGYIQDHLYGPGNTQMECGTCHSVHNTGNTGERLLWRSDQNSRLCLTCHAKGTPPGTTTP